MGMIIESQGNCLILNIDGDRLLFYPTGAGDIWTNANAGQLKIETLGNMLVVNTTTAKLIGFPTNAFTWIVNGTFTPDPDPDVFKWPFDNDDWTTYENHSGIDWGYALGTDIPITGPGTVIEVYNNSSNTFPFDDSEPEWRGNCIVVDHGFIDGHQIWSLYAHMLNNPVWNIGDEVSGGDIAGKIGNSGFSNGAHLHYEIIYDGDRLTTSEGGGAERTVAWMNAHTDGSNW